MTNEQRLLTQSLAFVDAANLRTVLADANLDDRIILTLNFHSPLSAEGSDIGFCRHVSQFNKKR